MFRYIVPAALAAFLAASPAAAMPMTAPSGLAPAANAGLVQEAQARPRARRYAPRRVAPRRYAPRRVAPRRGYYVTRRYAPGARLRVAPRGWRRYGARPVYWRTRGCVLVGPVWFCP